MDEKGFKKHLKDLAHGDHHPEEHDWSNAPRLLPERFVAGHNPKKAKATAKKRSKARNSA